MLQYWAKLIKTIIDEYRQNRDFVWNEMSCDISGHLLFQLLRDFAESCAIFRYQ